MSDKPGRSTEAAAAATTDVIATSSVNLPEPSPTTTSTTTPSSVAALAAPAGNATKTDDDRRDSDSFGSSNSSSSDPRNLQFNPISKWEEPIEIVGLTQWDVHCKPRHIQNEDNPNARIRVSVKQLSTEMTCPVCLGFFNKPVTVMECLHRFCAECIEKCLRMGKKECPSCRIHIPSRRSLR